MGKNTITNLGSDLKTKLKEITGQNKAKIINPKEPLDEIEL